MHGLRHSGVTSNAGARLSPIRRRNISSRFRTAWSLSAGHTERRRRKTSEIDSNRSANTRHPAIQMHDKTRVTVVMVKKVLNDQIGFNTVSLVIDDGFAGAIAGRVLDSGTTATLAGDS